MTKQDAPGGAVVNTSSINGLGGATAASLYVMAKAGGLALTKSAAQEYAKGGIRVNALVAALLTRRCFVTQSNKFLGMIPSFRFWAET